MNIRPDIAALIRDGHSIRYIAAEARASKITVRKARHAMGYPAYEPRTVLTIEQVWDTYAKPGDDGHAEWTGPTSHNGVPVFTRQGVRYQARAVQFRQQYGRDPIGYVKTSCDRPRCVAHVADQPMREQLAAQYAAIFGGTR